MIFTLRILGTEVLHISTTPDAEPDEYDPARDLSGGTLGIASEVYATGDRFMGFTNGRDEE